MNQYDTQIMNTAAAEVAREMFGVDKIWRVLEIVKIVQDKVDRFGLYKAGEELLSSTHFGIYCAYMGAVKMARKVVD